MIKQEDRVDYETARALKLLGMPQGRVNGKGKNIQRLKLPHYVTVYRQNMIHKYIPDLNIGHIHMADIMCYAPSKEEACKWLLSQISGAITQEEIEENLKNYSNGMLRKAYLSGLQDGHRIYKEDV